MSANSFLQQISDLAADQNEDPADIKTLIDVLGFERYLLLGGELDDSCFEFAGKFWCPLTDIVKNENYAQNVEMIRKNFKGVSQSREVRERLRKSLKPTLITAPSIAYVVKIVDNEGIGGVVETEFILAPRTRSL
ncbi:MAG: hypothetical protein AAGI44_01105 [Pseudomonadota bacterium]